MLFAKWIFLPQLQQLLQVTETLATVAMEELQPQPPLIIHQVWSSIMKRIYYMYQIMAIRLFGLSIYQAIRYLLHLILLYITHQSVVAD